MERTAIKIILSFVVVLLVCSCAIMVLIQVTHDKQTNIEASHDPPEWNSGTLCNIPNEPHQGECVALANCVAYGKSNNVTSQSSVEKSSFIKRIECNSSENVSFVCCPRSSIVYNEMNANETVVPFHHFASCVPVDFNSCGLQASMPNIIGGHEAKLDEFPWMAMLWYQQQTDAPTPGCGGALISPTYVITAAHCVTGSMFRQTKSRLKYVRLREHNINTDPDCTLENDMTDCSDPVLNLEPKAIIPHPEYDEASRNYQHDIALIRIDQTPPFSDYLRSICLPEQNFEIGATSGTKLVASGWGRTNIFKDTFGSDVPSPVKLKLVLPYVIRNTCKETFQQHAFKLGPGQMCAGGERGKDTCIGDSGTPLMSFDIKRGIWFITGIVSFGVRGCGFEGVPGVYTNVYHYMPWIRNITGL